MVTLDLEDWSIRITSVPRGTYSSLPPGGSYKETDYYVSNACAFGGLDYGVSQIEKIVGVKADYVATVGFSQALGIFRVLELPTTETLQWLRHRQTYAIGDPQRSQNQAVFMKDVALRLLGGDGISTPVMHILYSLVDTDLDFKTAQALYTAYRASEIEDRPEDIRLAMRPHFDTRIYHFDPENADEQVGALVAALQGRLSSRDLTNKSVEELQAELETYLRESLASDETVVHVYEEQLWRQLEDEDDREELHFRFLEKYVKEIRDTDHDKAVELVTDYVLEKQYFELTSWEQKGRSLLASLLEE
jgi:anionic cell wall polymer biosynthesis LytR-Cps2A-Psr (LCP) family protein